MSKSRGTGISPELYLDLGLNPEWLRYYIAAKLNANVEDMDFNPDDFVARVNSDLIGKYVNIASRAARFIAQTGNKLAATSGFDVRHGIAFADAGRPDRAALCEPRNSARRCARSWSSPIAPTNTSTATSRGKRRSDPRRGRECSNLLGLHRRLPDTDDLLKPVLPGVAASVELFLQIPSQAWRDLDRTLPAGHAIGAYSTC